LYEFACKKEFQTAKDDLKKIKSRQKYKSKDEMARTKFNDCMSKQKTRFSECCQKIMSIKIKQQLDAKKAQLSQPKKVKTTYIRKYKLGVQPFKKRLQPVP
jgi:hypothetical protein